MTTPDPRYARHLALPRFGVDGQQRLESSSVLVVGLGGLGSVASLYLANAGVGRLLLNDFDRVDATNLPRQVLFRADDVGRPKTEVTLDRLQAANPAPAIKVIDRRLDARGLEDAVAGVDVVLDCTDNFPTRVQLNTACVTVGRPLVSGAAIRFEGQLAVLADAGAGGPCYRCLYSEEDENLESCAGQGVLAPVPGTIGAMMATETLKLLLGIPSGLRNRLWVYDALAGATRSLAISRNPDCPVCG